MVLACLAVALEHAAALLLEQVRVWAKVEAGAQSRPMQQREREQIDADRRQPLPHAAARTRLRQRQRTKARQQPQRDRLHAVGQTQQGDPVVVYLAGRRT